MEKIQLNDIEIELFRSAKRKTVSVSIERDGRVISRIPDKITNSELVDILKVREEWIQRHLLAKKEEISEEPLAKQPSYSPRRYAWSAALKRLKGTWMIEPSFFWRTALPDRIPLKVASTWNLPVLSFHNLLTGATGATGTAAAARLGSRTS